MTNDDLAEIHERAATGHITAEDVLALLTKIDLMQDCLDKAVGEAEIAQRAAEDARKAIGDLQRMAAV